LRVLLTSDDSLDQQLWRVFKLFLCALKRPIVRVFRST
jgi:hypothetical protein